MATHLSILHRIAQGSARDVFLCEGPGGRQLALKRLHDRSARSVAAKAALCREEKIGTSLQHHNLVKVLGQRTYGGSPGLTMEYVDGLSLAQALSVSKHMPFGAALSVTRQLISALIYLHENSHTDGPIVHGDLKPANVLIGLDGVVKLADLGSCILPGETSPSVLRGTLRYMAPEQARGEGLSVASDQYSLGLILGEMIFSQPVYQDKTSSGLLSKVRRGDLEWVFDRLKKEQPNMLAFLRRVLHAEASERFLSMVELKEAFVPLDVDPIDSDFSLKGLILDADVEERRDRRRREHSMVERWAAGPVKDWYIYEWAAGELPEQAASEGAVDLELFIEDEAPVFVTQQALEPEAVPIQPKTIGRRFPGLLRSFRGATRRSDSSNFLNRIKNSLGSGSPVPSRR